MNGFEWDNVRLVLALLRAGTVDAAASQLGVDRSTISRRLGALEAALGAPLFARTRDGLKPTPAAQRLRPLAEQMEASAVRLRGAAAAGAEGAEGVVRVATTEAMASHLVSQGLLTLSEQYPDLGIELLAGSRPLDLGRGEADVAVRLVAVREPSLSVRCVARVAIGLFATPGYLQSRGPVRSRAGLQGHDVLLPTGELARLPESRWLASRKGVRVVFRSNSMTALVAAAVAGRGITALGVTWRRPELRQLLVLEELPKRPIFLVTRAEDRRRPAVRLVVERIGEILEHAVG